MELNINSPSYFTQQYGVIDEIYNMCKESKKCEAKAGFASVSLQIDYETYVNADIDEKKEADCK